MRRRWNDPTIQRALERYAPRYLPGVPLEAALCLGASSTGPREDLGTAVGLFGVERSRINAWASDAETREVLGRAYDATRYATDLEAQVFTGMRRYREALDAARSAVGRVPFDVARITPWEYQCAVSAYSSGPGALQRLVTPRVSRLASIPVSRRFPDFARDVYDVASSSSSSNTNGLPLRGITGAAWAVTRPRERYETARALSRALARPAGWYVDAGVAPDVDATLASWAHT